jgi:hypothetical protein
MELAGPVGRAGSVGQGDQQEGRTNRAVGLAELAGPPGQRNRPDSGTDTTGHPRTPPTAAPYTARVARNSCQTAASPGRP